MLSFVRVVNIKLSFILFYYFILYFIFISIILDLDKECDVMSFFLSLLLPSCIVALIRELKNITQTPAIMSFNSFNLASDDDINMVTDPLGTMFNLNNNLNEVRDRSLDASTHRPRSPSLSSSENKEEYHVHV